MVLKRNSTVFSYFLPIFLLGVLIAFVFMQCFWVKTMYRQELWRLETEMLQKVVDTSILLEDEVILLPTLLKTKKLDKKRLIEKTMTGISFWMENAISSELYSNIWIIDMDNPLEPLEWDGSTIQQITQEEAENDSLPPLNTLMTIINEFHGKYEVSYITLPSGAEYILAPFLISDSSLFIICKIDMLVLAQTVIPVLVRNFFDNEGTYYMRVIDCVTGNVIYQTSPNLPESIFDNPDFSWNVFSAGNQNNQTITYTFIDSARNFSIENFSDGLDQAFAIFRNKNAKIFDEDAMISAPFGIEENYEQELEKNYSGLLLQVIHKDGSVLQAAWNLAFLNGSISFVIFIILLLGILLLQRNLRKAQRLSEKQSEFISTVTHELKTPVAVISSASQNMMDGIVKNQEKIKQYGVMIKKESDRLRTTIDFFLLYGNLNNTSHFTSNTINLSELLIDVVARNETVLLKSEFTINMNICESDVFVTGDKTALTCVIQNMIDNVAKHAKSGKYLGFELFIEGEASNKVVVLKIIDKGHGIPKKEQSTIFDLFTRGVSAKNCQVEGSGIGLNLVRRIIIIHKGSISLESSNIKGSVFAIRLPITITTEEQ